jgi:hypothetical protein
MKYLILFVFLFFSSVNGVCNKIEQEVDTLLLLSDKKGFVNVELEKIQWRGIEPRQK